MFSPSDVSAALGVDSWTYDRLSQRIQSNDTAGERAKLFVDLLDTDINALDLHFVLGYLEVKALVELGVMLLPPPAEWPATVPSTRPYIPATEPAYMAALQRASGVTAASPEDAFAAVAAASASASASGAAAATAAVAGGGGGSAEEDALALANAVSWRPPSAAVAKHFAASKESAEPWADILALLESHSVPQLRRLGFVSALPKSVWAAAGDVMFPESVAAAAPAAAAASGNAFQKKHAAAVAEEKRRKLLAKMREKKQQQQQQQLEDERADDGEEEQEEDADAGLDEYELELRELRRRRDNFLRKLERDKRVLLQRPKLLIGAALLNGGDDDDANLALLADMIDSSNSGAGEDSAFTADRNITEGTAAARRAKRERLKAAMMHDVRVTPVHLRIHGFSADPSSFYANAIFAERQRGGGSGGGASSLAENRRSLVTLATMQRRGEVAARRAKLAEGTAVSMHAALDVPGAVLVDWHKQSSIFGSNIAPTSAAAGDLSPSPSGSAQQLQQQQQQQSLTSAGSAPVYYLSATERKPAAPISVVSEDSEFWLALKGVVFRIPWKNVGTNGREVLPPSSGSRDDEAINNNHDANGVSRKNLERAAAGRRMYYRTVMCPLHTGFDITATFLTAPGRALDPPAEQQQGLEHDGGGGDDDDTLLAELEAADDKAGAERSPLSQVKKAFRRPCRVHINRVFALLAHDSDVVGELVDCEQSCNPPWF